MTLVLNGTTGVSAVDGSASTPAIQGNDTNTGMFFPAADTVAVATGGTEAMRIDSAGNVGVGTSSPSSLGRLTLSSSSASNYTSITAGSVTSLVGTDSSGLALSALGANNVVLYTGGTERARIDSSGNVGIGTSSPTNNLQVEGKASAYAVALVKSNGGAGNGYGASFQLTNTNGDNYQIRVADSGSGSTYQQALDFLTISAPSGKGLRFSAGGGESARIDSSGNLLVGTTSSANSGAGTRMQIAYAGGGTQYGLGFRPTTNITVPIQFGNASGTTVGQISQDASNVAYNTSSDYRLKEDVQPMTGALTKVAALKPCTYKWKVDGSSGEGFIAHELAEVCPRAVSGEKDAVNEDGSIKPQGIDTSFLVATLTAAIQELNAKVESLTAEIATLKGAQA